MENYKFDKKPVKVDLGCGINYYKGVSDNEIDEWIHVDGDKSPHIEIVCKFEEGIPIESGIVDMVHCSEVIEHIPKFNEEKIMSEFNRIMKIGAVFFGTTPNMTYSFEEYLAGRMPYKTVMANLYGDQFYYPHCHYRLFTEHSIVEFLEKWGFGDVDLSKSPGRPSTPWWLVFECKKIKNL